MSVNVNGNEMKRELSVPVCSQFSKESRRELVQRSCTIELQPSVEKSDMRGFNAGGTTEYRTATTRSRDGEEMEGGFSGGNGSKVKNREVEEEEVHGRVEAVVAGYDGDDEAVAQEGSQVDAQEEPEVQELQLPRVCKCQEEELDTPVLPGQSSSKLEILSISI
ncbi:hypothetical protein QYF61_010279, partial [Mycteria americana]